MPPIAALWRRPGARQDAAQALRADEIVAATAISDGGRVVWCVGKRPIRV